MKKIQQNKYIEIPSTNLCRDEIEQLILIMKGQDRELNICSNNYVFDSLDELIKECGENINNLELRLRTPYVSLSFKRKFPSGTSLYSADDEGDMVYYPVRELLISKVSLLSHIFTKPIGILGYIGFLLLIPFGYKVAALDPISCLAVFALCILLIVVSALTQSGTLFSLTLIKRSARRNFWARNKDQIIICILSVIITLVIPRLYHLITILRLHK